MVIARHEMTNCYYIHTHAGKLKTGTRIYNEKTVFRSHPGGVLTTYGNIPNFDYFLLNFIKNPIKSYLFIFTKTLLI